MNAFQWLNDLMLWLGKWVPRPVLITAGNLGVLFGRNGWTEVLVPGFYVYWPMTSNLQIVSTRRRTTEIAGQLWGRECLALVVSYHVSDPATMMLTLNDCFAQLDDRAQVYLGLHYEAGATNAAISAGVFASMVEEFAPYGVTVHSVDIISRGRVIPLKNINDWAQHAKAEL